MSREYLFLSPDDRYRDQVRAFVLKNSQAARKIQKDAEKKSGHRANPAIRSKRPREAAEYSKGQSSPASLSPSDVSVLLRILAAHYNAPSTDSMLGKIRTDPFNTLALTTTRRDDVILNHCTYKALFRTKLGSNSLEVVNDSILEYGRVRADSFFPPRNTFRHQFDDDLDLVTCLHFGAASLAHYYPTDQKLREMANGYRLQSLRLLRKRIEDGSMPSDKTIHAVIGMLAVNLQVDRETSIQDPRKEILVHVQGLRSVLARRDGFNPLAYSIPLRWDLFW